ncbi:MAG: hypothetical protein ACRD3C_03775 [Vicinamibacterales bacterium]
MRRLFGLAVLLLVALLPTPTQTQTGTLMPVPQIQFLDSNGVPCSGCLLETYAAGTSTPLATFSDNLLTVANTNPIVLNANGRNPAGGVYLSLTSYKFILKTAGGATIYTQDNVSAVPSAGANLDIDVATAGETLAAGEVVYMSDGSGGLIAGRWYKADADNTYSSSAAKMVGLAASGIANGASGSIRLQGRFTGLAGLTIGASYFISTTAGAFTTTPPTNARFLGAADSTTTFLVAGNPLAVSGLTRSVQIQAASPYTLQWPAADAAGALESNGAGVLSFAATDPTVCQGRLTLTTGVPVTTADVTAAGTLFFTPYQGNRCSLYNGTSWARVTLTERSLALTVTSGSNYDVFLFDNAGTLTLELSAAWTNDTTRMDALVSQDGIPVKSGATTRRFLGTIRGSAMNQTEDSEAKRYVWNHYNRKKRSLRITDATNSWTYTTATFRQANGALTNQVDVVVGQPDAFLEVSVLARPSNASNIEVAVGIGEDSTTTPLTPFIGGAVLSQSQGQQFGVHIKRYVPLGRHFYAWLEWSTATGTTTWFGDNNTTREASGMYGWIEG